MTEVKVKKDLPIVLTIAGSDSSAGAGIQQDLKTITAMGCYGATVITAITSQNTLGVQGVMPVPADVVKTQLTSVLSDLNVSAVKIGMIPNRDVAIVITEVLREWCDNSQMHYIVLDPVMISTSGTRLMEEECIDYIKEQLVPLTTLVTPNLPESILFQEPYKTNFLIKGGHADSHEMTDILCCLDGRKFEYSSPKIASTNLHGTGCTLSSAIACALAMGKDITEAVSDGKEIINKGIQKGKDLYIGKGNGPLWLFD